MKRRRRKRSTRRRGVQHIGDILAELLNDIEDDEMETGPLPESRPAAAPIPGPATDAAGQNTFAFYQPVEV